MYYLNKKYKFVKSTVFCE